MNASLVRMKKEARALFWPWCAVMAAGALPLFWDPPESGLPGMKIFAAFAPAGFFLGIPLLAALSFGDEFQHRTLPVVLGQPVSRMKIWREKLAVAAFAVLSATAVFYFSGRLVLNQEQLVTAGLYVLTMTTAAARSAHTHERERWRANTKTMPSHNDKTLSVRYAWTSRFRPQIRCTNAGTS